MRVNPPPAMPPRHPDAPRRGSTTTKKEGAPIIPGIRPKNKHPGSLTRLLSTGQYEKALAVLKARLRRDKNSFALWLDYAHLLRLLSKFREAQEAYEEAWRRCGGKEEEELPILLGLAATFRGRGDLKRSWVFLEEATTIIRRLHLRESYPHFHWNRAMQLRHEGRLEEARKALLKGLYWARRLKDREGEAYLLAARGGLNRVRGRFRSSLKDYGKALSLFTHLYDPFGIAYSSCGMGNALRMLERWEEAWYYLKRALSYYRVQGDNGSRAYTLWSLGTLAKLKGEYSEAQRCFLKAEELFRNLEDRRGLAYAELGLLELKARNPQECPEVQHLLRKLSEELRQQGFLLEANYARLLEALLGGKPSDLRAIHRDLRKMGTLWFQTSLPLNIP